MQRMRDPMAITVRGGGASGGEAELVGSEEIGGEAVAGVPPISLVRLIFACMVAGGVQYGWALQLSLLTPYVQFETLGISHTLASLLWLCGPVAGFLVQPTVGYWSDKCRSRFGKRRPFIFAGCISICIAVIMIGYSSDIGYALGDTREHCSVYHGHRWIAAAVFILGFWLLDLSNNAVQGPARALMADLSGTHGCNVANAIFCSWMAFGNILGYMSGASGKWHKWFPFLLTRACCEACANLKGAFLVSVVFLIFCMAVTLIIAKEVYCNDFARTSEIRGTTDTNSQSVHNEGVQRAGFLNVFKAFQKLPPGMPSVLLVTSLTWLSWFPFILYDTDWMGREVYHGKPKGSNPEIDAYNRGVREGAFGLLLNSIVLGVSSLMIEPLCRKFSARIVWVFSNFIVFACMTASAIISVWSLKVYHGSVGQAITADSSVKAAALALFAILGFPLAILYSVPFAVTAQLAVNEGSGQGLCIGVLNVSIILPQVVVALAAGPWDSLFNKGNIPAFAFASAVAFLGGLVGFMVLPKLSSRDFKTSGLAGLH